MDYNSVDYLRKLLIEKRRIYNSLGYLKNTERLLNDEITRVRIYCNLYNTIIKEPVLLQIPIGNKVFSEKIIPIDRRLKGRITGPCGITIDQLRDETDCHINFFYSNRKLYLSISSKDTENRISTKLEQAEKAIVKLLDDEFDELKNEQMKILSIIKGQYNTDYNSIFIVNIQQFNTYFNIQPSIEGLFFVNTLPLNY